MTTARELSDRIVSLLRREHEAMADFLVALADFDEKRLWLELGQSSLFSYLNRELGLSKGAAFFRNTAARLVRRYPEIVEPLRDGRLCLTSLAHLAKVITPENKAEMLPRFFQRSKSEAKEIVAEILPEAAPPHRAMVTALKPAPALNLVPAPVSGADLPPTSGFPENLLGANSSTGTGGLLPQGERTLPPEPSRAVVEPLTNDLRRLHLTVSKRFLDKLSAARDALSHSKPGATHEEILEAGLDLLLAGDAKRKAIVAKPRKTPPSSGDSRHVPAHVRREVFLRDGGRCQFPLESGGICGSTYRVQLGHLVAHADGGLPTKENLRCECERHNQHRADLDFGKPFMDQFRKRRRRSRRYTAGAVPLVASKRLVPPSDEAPQLASWSPSDATAPNVPRPRSPAAS